MQSVLVPAIAATMLVAPLARAQQSSANIIERPGHTVEVLGLRRWTVAMIQDSLAKYAPGDSLHTHGCAAALRYKLGFADAAVMGYRVRMNHTHTLVVLREPQDSALVRSRPVSFDTTGNLSRYARLIALYRASPRAFHHALGGYPLHRSRRLAHPDPGVNPDTVRAIWQELARHTSDADRKRAMTVLRSDPSIYDRSVAAAVLANFPQHDATWHALVDAMLESDGMVRGIAADLARNMSVANRRTVEWAPVLRAIRAMMDGTGLFHTNALMETLVNTGIPRHYAWALLDGKDPIVFHLAAATLPPARQPARAFLTHLSGVDHGDDVDAWRRWRTALVPHFVRTGAAR